MSTFMLRTLFKQKGIRFLKAHYKYTSETKYGDEIHVLRKRFTVQLVEAITSKSHVIYMDETTVNTWCTLTILG